MSQGFFEGAERLAVFDGLGHLTRKGDARALAVSDRRRVAQAIEAGDPRRTLAYLEALVPRHRDMLDLLLEWALQYPASARASLTDAEERTLTARALTRFARESESVASDPDRAGLLQRLGDLLAAAGPETAPALRREEARGGQVAASAVLRVLAERLDALKTVLTDGDRDGARARLDAYYDACVTLHDALVNFTSAYPAAAMAERGPAFALELVRHSFSSLSVFEQFWALPKVLDPEARAAFLAEHLRCHFSGSERGGSVHVEEDEDRFRLIVDPCGSGGALRRRLGNGLRDALVPDAVPMTWMRVGEVPVYCSHCAFNELVSVERFGYPVLVTAFDPDPSRPCGWTVYKRPEAVPESCFARLGKARP